MSCLALGVVSMASFGESLKRERELREISLRQISEATKINLRYLEALEENRFEALPGGLFNKGFIRAYATYIGIDGEAMVDSYLNEMKARQPGTEAATSRGVSNLHRPQEVPQRRAAPGAGTAGASSAATPPSRRKVQETRASSVAVPNPPNRAPSQGEARATLAALERVLDVPARPAVSGIEVSDPLTPASSRVLVWVLSLVAAAGVLFLILSLVRGTMPGQRPVPERPAANDAAAPGAPPGGADRPAPDGGGATGATDGSAVVPDISSQSPLMLGAAGPPPAKAATPAPTAAPSRPAPVTQAPLPLPQTAHPDDRPAVPIGREDDRAGRGPMKTLIAARSKAYVVVSCDGREVLNRALEPGETEKAKCDTVVRVSASDAGAVILSVNGATCLPLGDPGTRAYGYTIRIDDYPRICPTSSGGSDGRP